MNKSAILSLDRAHICWFDFIFYLYLLYLYLYNPIFYALTQAKNKRAAANLFQI